jgi:ferredoxin
MKIVVDHATCQGHARCFALDPDLFALDDDGYSAIDEETVPPGREDLARRAIGGCPERAITIKE